MITEVIDALPAWVVVGAGLGTVFSLIVASVFFVGDRLFPTAARSDGHRVDGLRRRRAEIREYLRGIDEPFAENHPVDGVVVDFYLANRNVAVTFDAQTYFRLRASDVHVVLAEHEMPANHLGRRLPFDVSDREFAPRSGSDPVAAAFDRLELPQSADVDEVKSAYRSLVKEVHPDQGGDEAEFKRVREAYATARQHAEQTG